MEKAAKENTQGFWTTLPGILTGVAALVTAITGLILGLYQYGVLGKKPDSTAKSPAYSASQEINTPTSTQPVQPANSSSAPTQAGQPHTAVVITANDGKVTTLFADGFRQTAQYDTQLHLLSEQAIAFDRIKSVEVLHVYSQHAEIQITLADGKVMPGTLGAGSSIYGFGGENDLGTFSITVDHLKKIVFQH